MKNTYVGSNRHIQNVKEIGYKNKTHGMSKTSFYNVWNAMRARCENRNLSRFKDYGGRGIIVCKRWKVFENFMDDMYIEFLEACKKNGRKNTTLDRIDNNGNYTKENCRWTKRIVQANNVRNNRLYEYDGEKLSIAQWARKTGIKYSVLYWRLVNAKWDTSKSLNT